MVQVKGNGNIVSRSYPVDSFLRLHIAVKGVTELIHSQEEKVEVEMDENLLEHFEALNHGRTLFVSTEGKLRVPSFSHSKVRIYFRQLENLVIRCDGGEVASRGKLSFTTPLEIKVQSSGNVNLALQAPALKVLLQMEGDIRLSGEVGQVEIKTQSEGNLMARELKAKDLVLKNTSQGNVEVFASETISITHSGHGNVHYYGEGRLADVRHYGQGELRHCE